MDWNGNVLGVAPVTIELTPSFSQYASHYSWPSNGDRTQRFRARWPDGAMNTEFFDSDTPPPQAIAIAIAEHWQLPRHLDYSRQEGTAN